MTVAEKCKRLIERSRFTQKEIAKKIGTTAQNLSNKMSRNTLSAEEFLKIVEACECKVQIVNAEDEQEQFAEYRGVGPRLKMMVNGVTYDTYKADAICHTDETQPTYDEVYREADGRYFVAHYVNWEGGVSSISPISNEDAESLIDTIEGIRK